MSVLCYKLFHVFFSSPGEMEWTRFLSAWWYYLAGKDDDATQQQRKFQTSFMLFMMEILSFLCLFCVCVYAYLEDISSDLYLTM